MARHGSPLKYLLAVVAHTKLLHALRVRSRPRVMSFMQDECYNTAPGNRCIIALARCRALDPEWLPES